MGLDGVELIMAVEERFGIDIPDEDTEKLTTPGYLHIYVLGRLREGLVRSTAEAKGEGKLDLRGKVEANLRRFLSEELGLDEEKMVAETPLHRLIPRKIRRSVWAALKKETGLPLPKLRRPAWVKASITAVLILGACSLSLLWGSWVLGTLAAGLVSPFVVMATLPMARNLPREAMTFGALVDYALSHQDGLILVRAGGDLWPIVRAIVVEQLSVKPEDVTPTARFVEDLGVG